MWEQVDLARFPIYLAGSDLGVVLYQTIGKNLQYGFSTKLFDYLRAGLPVIISGNPISAEIVRREAVGTVIPEPPRPKASLKRRLPLFEMRNDTNSIAAMRFELGQRNTIGTRKRSN